MRGCDDSGHDFAFWPSDDDDVVICACGAQAALFDPATGDFTGFRMVS